MSAERWRQYQIAKATGDTDTANRLLSSALVNINVPTGQELLSEPERRARAKKEQEKIMGGQPLSPTDQKGVKATIEEILGEGKTLPFGILPGAALKQEDMNKLWEEAMEATGYSGRGGVAQKQIEQEFDMQVKTLNKGKGLGKLAKQYQWDRRKYELSMQVYKSSADKSSHQSIIKVWGNLPKKMQAMITALRATGKSWEEIATADDLKPYLR
jgi:hypothetical protein